MARRKKPTLQDELRKRYFFIDYLRMHRHGKRSGLFRKNRAMLDSTNCNDPKKGYKAYVQRIFRDILLHETKEIINKPQDIIKPRNFFGYEIGRKEDRHRDKLDLSAFEDRIKQVLRMYRLLGTDESLINEYVEVINECTMIKTKNRHAGLVIRLDDKRSDGWKAYQEIKNVVIVQKKILEQYTDTTEFLKVLVAHGLKKSRKISVGMKVRYNNVIYTITLERDNRYDDNKRYDLVAENGSSLTSILGNTFEVIDHVVSADFERSTMQLTAITEIHSYIEEFLGSSTNMSVQNRFTLARSALIRTARTHRQQELLTTLREITFEIYSEFNGEGL